jgi:RNA ligase
LNLDIKKFYEHPQVMHREWNDLVLFCYTRECQYDQLWDDVTMAARGIIFNRITGEIVARPFKKFFNAAELTGKVDLNELAKKPFVALTKIDGSLAIFFKYDSQDYIATKGSFESEQAVWGTKWCREHIKSDNMLPGHTYLFEMIYPENKIVVDYGNIEDLVLLGVINNETGGEISYTSLKEEGKRIGSTVVQAKEFSSLDELYAYCKALPATEEGFVVTFYNGLKIKVKGDEYTKIHRILSYLI